MKSPGARHLDVLRCGVFVLQSILLSFALFNSATYTTILSAIYSTIRCCHLFYKFVLFDIQYSFRHEQRSLGNCWEQEMATSSELACEHPVLAMAVIVQDNTSCS